MIGGLMRRPLLASLAVFLTGLLILNFYACQPQDAKGWEKQALAALADPQLDAAALDQVVYSAGRALELDSTRVEAAYALAQGHRKRGEYEAAAQVYRHLVEAHPEAAEAYAGLGLCLAAQGRYNGALRAYQDALRLGLEESAVYMGLGHAYQALGHRRENLVAAEASYRAALGRATAPTADVLYHLARVAARLEKTEESVALYTEALARAPQDSGVRAELAALHVQSGQRQRAGGVLAAGLALRPDAAELRYELGRLLWGDKDADGALEQFRLALAADPSLGTAHRYMGLIYSAKGQYPQALDSFRALEAQRTNDAGLLVNIGIVLAQQGNLKGAEGHFRRALELGDTGGDAALKLGGLYIHRNDPSAALKVFGRGLESNPLHAELHASLGDAYRRLGAVGSAIAAGEEAVRLEPRRALWNFHLALSYERLDPEAARRSWGRYIELAQTELELGVTAETDRLRQARRRLAELEAQ
jgi:tetratricopeptide (TPR) repeat protein